MVAEETLYSYVGTEPFDTAREIKTRKYWSQESRDAEFKNLLDRTERELEMKLARIGILPAGIRAEYLDSLKFHLMGNAGIEIPLTELQRMASEKNIDGTSSYLPPAF